jgi:hypothetical protein
MLLDTRFGSPDDAGIDRPPRRLAQMRAKVIARYPSARSLPNNPTSACSARTLERQLPPAVNPPFRCQQGRCPFRASGGSLTSEAA